MISNSVSYMMQLKEEPTGHLNLNADDARRLGLVDLEETQLKAIAAMVMTRPVTVAEAAFTLLEIPTIHKSYIVEALTSAPPPMRMKTARYCPFQGTHFHIVYICMSNCASFNFPTSRSSLFVFSQLSTCSYYFAQAQK